ncbi:MAG: hypothetical protein IJ221_06100 [Oscillibacter sp.]|nr:hypothetical protein [Oscillibacter sp.]
MTAVRAFFRTHPMLSALCAAGVNLAYALFNGGLGLWYRSWWFGALAAFYAVLALLRLWAMGLDRRGRGAAALQPVGLGMFALAVVLSGMVLLTIRERQNPAHPQVVMLAIATYTFAAVGWTVASAVRDRRTPSPSRLALRSLSCAGAIGSVLSLERSMLGTYGDAAGAFALRTERLSGAAAFLLLVLLGLGLLRRSQVGQGGKGPDGG